MQSSVPHFPTPTARTAGALATRWRLALALLVLLLSAPGAWAQSYLIGTDQTVCAGTLYDSGGDTGNYSSSENLTTVLTPATAGAKIRLTFTVFDTENNYDFLKVYDGPTASAPLLGSFAGSAQPGVITATNPTGQLTLVFTSDISVTYAGFAATITCAVNLPNITSFTPTSGPAGTTVVLTGTNFTGTTAISISGTPVTVFTVNSATQITLTVPANALSGPFVVTTPNGTTTSAGSYNTGTSVYLIGIDQTTCSGVIYDSGGPNGDYTNNQYMITVLTPATAGAKIRLTFTAFDTENSYDFLKVYDGPTASAPLLGSFTGTTLPGVITATNPTGQLTLVFTSDGSGFRPGFAATITCAVNLPNVTSFTPTSGPAGTTVVLTGTNFTGATAITLNGTPVTVFTVNSATQITLTVPANALSGPFVVTTPNGTTTSAGSYNTGNSAYLIGTDQTTCSGTIYDSGGATGNYTNNENLTTVLTPATASAKVQLTFTAFDLEATYDFLKIYDGPTASAPLLGSFTGTTIPSQATATNPTGQLTLVFTSDISGPRAGFAATITCAVNVPGIISFTPASGAVGTTVVITGTNLTGATAVSFNNIPATVFTVNSATQITATVPVGASTGPIRVTTPSATASSGTNFMVPAPTIASFTPTNGPAGTSVVITGTGFLGTTAVTLGGTPVTTFVVNSATQITITVPAGAYTGPIVVTTPAGTATSTGNYDTGNSAYLIGTNQTTCSGILFDSGGPNGDYTNNENRTTVLTPSNGSKIVLTFTAFNLENNYDYLKIYDGPTATAPLLGSFTGTTIPPGTIRASNSNNSGQLTLVFTSDGSGTRSGFAASISCSAPPTCTNVTSLTATAITSSSVVLNFTAGIGNNSYIITYTPAGGQPQTTTSTGTTVTLTGLQPASPYTITVQPVCTTGTSPNTITTVTFSTLLPNDEPCGALTLGTAPVSASNLNATTSSQNGINTPACSPAQLPKDVWFAFTATAATQFYSFTGNAAGMVRIFTSADCAAGPFVQIRCFGTANNTSVGVITVPNLTVGQRYYMAVSGFGGSDVAGTFTITRTLTATKAQANTEALVVYPNPSATGQLTLRMSGVNSTGQAVLLNALGQVVRTKDLVAKAEQEMTTRGLAVGIYTLRVTVAGQVLTRKVVLE